MQRILVCDDDHEIVEAISIYLTGEGFKVLPAYDGAEALEIMEETPVDLLIVDVMMPGLDGIRTTRQVREKSSIPIIILSAKSEDNDKILGLNIGADDYLTKPFDKRELLACISALLRRQGQEVNSLSFGDLSLELDSKDLSSGAHSLKLSKKEFELMRMLLQGKNQILSKEQILQKVWGYDSDAVENHVEVYVGFLRKKLRLLESTVSIQSRRGLGYFLAEQEESKKE